MLPTKYIKYLSILLAISFVAACTFGAPVRDEFVFDQTITPNQWSEQSPDEVDLPNTAPVNWLFQFNDQTMIELVEEALGSNLNLRSAQARVTASQAVYLSARGRALPQFSIQGSAGVGHSVADVSGQIIDSDFDTYSWGLSGSWEVDLWGRIDDAIKTQLLEFTASEADLVSARMSIVAQTALAWLSLNEAQGQFELAQSELETRKRALSLTERRFASGLISALDVRLSRSTSAAAQAGLAQSQQIRDEAIRRLEILLGRYPAAEINASGELYKLLPLEVYESPATLLMRRPDLVAIELRLEALGIRADLTRTAMMPLLTLSANAGINNGQYANLLDPDYLASQLIASVGRSLFSGGALKADFESAKARAYAALYDYSNAILNAWAEVENRIAADTFLAEREAAQKLSLNEAILAEGLAERQYKSGLANIFNLIEAQSRRINAERALISVRATRAANRIQYHLALGGQLPVNIDESK